VPQVVEAEVSDASPFHSALKGIADTERSSSCGIWEDQHCIQASDLGVLLQDVESMPGQRCTACLAVLRVSKDEQTALQVHIGPAQTQQFSASGARRQGQDYYDMQVGV